MSINCRLTTVMEFTDDKWKVVHFHGSLATGNEGDQDTWSVNELKERNKELERKVAERTEDLRVSLENLKATQSQLIQSEKMASLGELTAGIAHEIQNPLNFVNNFSEVSNELIDEMMEEIDNNDLEEVKAIAEDVKQNLDKINHHGKRARCHCQRDAAAQSKSAMVKKNLQISMRWQMNTCDWLTMAYGQKTKVLMPP